MHSECCLHVCPTDAFDDIRYYIQYLGNDGMFPSHDMKGAQNEITLIYCYSLQMCGNDLIDETLIYHGLS